MAEADGVGVESKESGHLSWRSWDGYILVAVCEGRRRHGWAGLAISGGTSGGTLLPFSPCGIPARLLRLSASRFGGQNGSAVSWVERTSVRCLDGSLVQGKRESKGGRWR